jgi:hypothetical protein
MFKTLITLLFIVLVGQFSAQAQFATSSKFDYRLLENKVLYIPEIDVNDAYAKKLLKRGKLADLKDEEAKAAAYSTAWREAISQSQYDATPYEIRKYDYNALIKNKDEKAMIIRYVPVDKYGLNWGAAVEVFHPKHLQIAFTFINDLDLGDSKDLRFIINALNSGLQDGAEIASSADKDKTQLKNADIANKFKREFVAFYDNKLKDMTLLVPYYEVNADAKEEGGKKLAKAEEDVKERNEDLVESMKAWTICKYEIVTKEEMEKRKASGDVNSFYWRRMPIYTQMFLFIFPLYHLNYFMSVEKDELIFLNTGGKKMTPKSVEAMQEEMSKNVEKYRKQLAKD